MLPRSPRDPPPPLPVSSNPKPVFTRPKVKQPDPGSISRGRSTTPKTSRSSSKPRSSSNSRYLKKSDTSS